jgi:hypothetical protein
VLLLLLHGDIVEGCGGADSDLTGFAPGAGDIDDRVLVQMDDTEGGEKTLEAPGSRNFRCLIFLLAERWLRHIDTVRNLPGAYDVDTSTGAQLDVIGSIVNLPRRGFGDARYRVFLNIQIQLLLSSKTETGNWTGTTQNLVSIVRTFVGGEPGSTLINLHNAPPYAYVLSAEGVPLDEIDLLAYFLCRAAYAGVLGHVLYKLADNSLWDSDHAGAPIADTGVWGSDHPGSFIADVSTWGTHVVIGGEGRDC